MTFINVRLLREAGLSQTTAQQIADIVSAADAAQESADTAQTSANTAQTTAEAAAESTHYWKFSPNQAFIWNADGAGVFPAGDPTQDLVANLFDPDGDIVSTATLRGTLDSSAGTISAISTISTTGITPTITNVNVGQPDAQAEISVELSSGKQIETFVSWVAFDPSTAGGTPASGGGK